ncbi:MAG: arginase [Clostridiales bacterium]|nr:arginase [Clostridiales bacterium]
MNINIIGVPTYYGSDKKGPELAPNKLRQNNIKALLSSLLHDVKDEGDVSVPYVEEKDKLKTGKNLKYHHPLLEVLEETADRTYNSLKRGFFPLIIGGDHSVALGSISGIAKYFNDLAVIWIDAHGDINTDLTSPSGNIHGMPLAALMGYGDESLVNLYSKGKKVPTENVWLVGAGDLDRGELDLISHTNLKVYPSSEVIKKGPEETAHMILDMIKNRGISNIHISFDIDFVDEAFVPGTGTPVKGGPNSEEAILLVKKLMDSEMVRSMDLVEYNVSEDKDDITLNFIMDFINKVFKM